MIDKPRQCVCAYNPIGIPRAQGFVKRAKRAAWKSNSIQREEEEAIQCSSAVRAGSLTCDECAVRIETPRTASAGAWTKTAETDRKTSKPRYGTLHAMSASKKRKTDLVFTGAAMFRQRIVCSLLSGKAIRIDHIRADEEAPGLTDYEASLLRLVDKVRWWTCQRGCAWLTSCSGVPCVSHTCIL